MVPLSLLQHLCGFVNSISCLKPCYVSAICREKRKNFRATFFLVCCKYQPVFIEYSASFSPFVIFLFTVYYFSNLLTQATFEPVSDPVSIYIYHETACEVVCGTWLSPYQIRSLGSVRMSSSGQEQDETC